MTDDITIEEEVEVVEEPVVEDDEVVVLGNGWYQVGDQKFHGVAALTAAGHEAPDAEAPEVQRGRIRVRLLEDAGQRGSEGDVITATRQEAEFWQRIGTAEIVNE